MKLLFVTGGSPATVFAMTPLATSCRNAGHRILIATNRESTRAAMNAGLPTICISENSVRSHIRKLRMSGNSEMKEDDSMDLLDFGEVFANIAVEYLPKLRKIVETWRPDIVIGGQLHYSAGLVSREFGLPYIRLAWDMGEPPELDQVAENTIASRLPFTKKNGLAEPTLNIGVCPPSVCDPRIPVDVVMQWVPYNDQIELRTDLLDNSYRTVFLTAGTKVKYPDYFYSYLRAMVIELQRVDARLLVSVPQDAAQQMHRDTGARVEWLPFDSVSKTVDLVVHHGGGGTALTAIAYGLPQVVLPNMPKLVQPAQRLEKQGAARVLLPQEENKPGALIETVESVLENIELYRRRSARLREEMYSMPTPNDIVETIERVR